MSTQHCSETLKNGGVLSMAKRKKLAKLLACVGEGTKKFGLWPTILADYQTISKEN